MPKKKSDSNSIKAKDFKVRFRNYGPGEKAIKVITDIIGAIMIIGMTFLIIFSIINQQFSNIIIYAIIMSIFFIVAEIIERKIKKNTQKRTIKDLIEKKVEEKRIIEQPIYHTSDVIEIEKDILVFVSYATKDADIFKIRDLAKGLTKFEKIGDVLYWQEDMKDNIIKYMNDNLGTCDVMLLFCSPNALISEPVEKEWTAADIMGKPIIPIFSNPDYIPPLLKTRLGVQFDPFDLKKNVNDIYNLILKKSEKRMVDIKDLKTDF